LAGDEPELARHRPPWHGGAVRHGPAISGGRSGRSKDTGASRLRGECGALQHGVNEAVERRVHDGGAMAAVGEEESAARRLTLARATLLGGARCSGERERNQEMAVRWRSTTPKGDAAARGGRGERVRMRWCSWCGGRKW
jgi:hypothetical protein